MTRLAGLLLGVPSAAWPSLAAAQAGDRSLEAGGDAATLIVVTLVVLAVLFLVVSIGYLYRRERDLSWDFQQREVPDEGGHH